ncbi:hypothetical protein [Streptomyces sp. ISL-100]|uniref:hypothetical protein n=1 Tax=Streptomyces sp. ISL-100 TaxID=2819173 RepID=UPI001BEC4FEE|nr:hypothetical protein [Streptomyces sp. ISL-100]MBT2395442.1 hypothetical protein [Streptomyces sp. ISL-100]
MSGHRSNLKLAEAAYFDRAQQNPEEQLTYRLAKAAAHVSEARGRGGKYAKAADDFFRAIVDFIPADGRYPATLPSAQHGDFIRGFHNRLGEYEATHRPLMK